MKMVKVEGEMPEEIFEWFCNTVRRNYIQTDDEVWGKTNLWLI